jgi:hypothetical protein
LGVSSSAIQNELFGPQVIDSVGVQVNGLTFSSPSKAKAVARKKSYVYRFLIVFLFALFIIGCGAYRSTQGSRTEELREWKREDQKRKKLLVFVHGFNSSKETAWGDFIDLILKDRDFDDFNIHLFGYPKARCSEPKDIQDLGDHFASFLSSELTKYKSVILVAHSMGGLVSLNALLALSSAEVSKPDIQVLTFGTPFMGVEEARYLTLFCKNAQGANMEALNNTLARLQKNWQRNFNKPGLPQIPIYPFRGIEDQLVTEASSCPGIAEPCDAVDGDHSSMVKPKDKKHLTYQKLLSRLNTKHTNHSVNIFIDCQHGSLPTKAPKDGRIWLLLLWPPTSQGGGGGLAQMTYPPGSEVAWPPAAIMGSHRCQLVNYGTVPIFNVSMEFQMVFKEAVRQAHQNANQYRSGQVILSRQWRVDVPKIDPGEPNVFGFYIYNTSELFVWVFPPKSAEFQLAGEAENQTVDLISEKNLASNGIMFTPVFETKLP